MENYPQWHIQRREKVNLLIDGTWFPNKLCLVVYRDERVKATLLYRLTDNEWEEEITEDIHVSGIEYAGLAQTQVELGAEEYFVIGDNNTASDDSRNPEVGNVSREDIYGKEGFMAGPAENRGFI